MSISRGKFITLEGGEGCGKTTNLTFIADFLHDHGKEVVVTREPGGTPLAEAIRTLLLNTDNDETVFGQTELLLIFAARAQHLQHKILPALAAGKWVICSRFVDSTYAYQGYARGIDLSCIAAIEKAVMGNFEPDLTILLDLPIEIGMARARDRAELDRIEQESLAFFDLVRQGLLKRAQQFPDRFAVMDANQPLMLVQKKIESILTPMMNG